MSIAIATVAIANVAIANVDWGVVCFWTFAAVSILPALGILFSREIVRAAFLLLASLSGFAGLYFMLGADFLGLVQVVVYIGGIMILILFGVMLTNRDPVLSKYESPWVLLAWGLPVALVTAGGLLYGLLRVEWPGRTPEGYAYTTESIGLHFMTDYILPFEVASVLLLVALVGAAYIARRPTGNAADTEES